MDWRDLFRAKPRDYPWCGPPPRHTVGHATKVGDSCIVCGTTLERAELPDAEVATEAGWRCPRCGTCYWEPADASPHHEATAT